MPQESQSTSNDIPIKGKLRSNSLVFIDTNFFKNYNPNKSAYKELFEHASNKKVVLCTSVICVEEWRTQKVSHINTTIENNLNGFQNLRNVNFLAKELLSLDFKNSFPNKDTVVNESARIIKEFIKENNILIYGTKESHIKNVWDAYFNGNSPFKAVKNKKDIPDAWITEAAKDALNENADKQNKFCICKDETLKSHLEKDLGFYSVSLTDLLLLLKNSEQDISVATGTKDSSKTIEATHTDNITNDSVEYALQNIDVNNLLLQKLILGYINWLDTAPKEKIIQIFTGKGYSQDLIENSAHRLVLNELIEDTGNYYIPKNKAICEQAANDVMDEIIELLEQ